MAKPLTVWLLRLIVRPEPQAFEERHRRALAKRRVTVVQGADGIGYVPGEVSAADAASIDAVLAATARSLGAQDVRTEQQRRSDLFADLLLGRLAFDQPDEETDDESDWLEVESIDPEAGEWLGTQLQRIDGNGELVGEPVDAATQMLPGRTPRRVRRPRKRRIGVVVPLASLLGANDAPGELADRSGFVPGEILREQTAEALDPNSRDELLFTRLLTDNWRSAARHNRTGPLPIGPARPGNQDPHQHLSIPTVPADRCDLDHHEPVPRGVTSGSNLDPSCRRHHRGKTFAWRAALRDQDGVDRTLPTAERYRCVDEPLPTGLVFNR